MGVGDASGTPLTPDQAKDRIALAGPKAGRFRVADDATVRRRDDEEVIGPNQLLVDAGWREEEVPVLGRAADPAAGPGHPAAAVPVAEERAEELERRRVGQRLVLAQRRH